MTTFDTASHRSTSPEKPFPKFGDDALHTLARLILAASLAFAVGYAATTYANPTPANEVQAATPAEAELPLEWRWERDAVSFDDMQRALRDSPVAARR